MYPRNCKQPIKEEYLLTGPLEVTNEPYAIAKISGIKMCESYNYQHKTNYLCLMPCNAFGPNDNYDLLTSHFLPALIRRLSDAAKRKQKSILKESFFYDIGYIQSCVSIHRESSRATQDVSNVN